VVAVLFPVLVGQGEELLLVAALGRGPGTLRAPAVAEVADPLVVEGDAGKTLGQDTSGAQLHGSSLV